MCVQGTNLAVFIVSAILVSRIRLHLWVLHIFSNVCFATPQNHSVYVCGFLKVSEGTTAQFKQL